MADPNYYDTIRNKLIVYNNQTSTVFRSNHVALISDNKSPSPKGRQTKWTNGTPTLMVVARVQVVPMI